MQNRYVGDIGDFGKYGLLRALFGSPETPADGPPLRLGVAWYLYPDEANGDGRFTDYLCAGRPALQSCDPALFGQLQALLYPAGPLAQARRQVVEIERRGILPPATVYHSDSLAYPAAAPRPARATLRQRWLAAALESTAAADAVFVDPDNGISETVDPLSRKGPKYVFIDDLQRFWGRGQSLIIYHHLGRQGRAAEQIRRVSGLLTQRLGLPVPPWALWYHRGTARVYFIIAQKAHEPRLARRLAAFQAGPWCRRPAPHFEFVGRIPSTDQFRLV